MSGLDWEVQVNLNEQEEEEEAEKDYLFCRPNTKHRLSNLVTFFYGESLVECSDINRDSFS